MKIDKRMNLVIPVEREDGPTVYVHATPVSAETFNQHFRIIAKVWSEIAADGFGVASGPRIAAKILRDIAERENVWDGAGGVEMTLMQEIKRLTMVLTPGGAKPPMLVIDAVKAGLLDAEEQDIVENAIVFFTAASLMLRGEQRRAMLEASAGLWAAQLTLLNSTAFLGSLPTSTETDNSGGTATD